MFKNRNYKFVLFALVAAIIVLPSVVFAGVDTKVVTPSVTGICDPKAADPLASCISRLYGIGISAIGIFAVLMIVVGGYLIMTAAGDTKKSALGREYIYGAVIGLVLALGAVLILRLINPDLVNLKEPSPSILVPKTTGGGPPGGGGQGDGQFTFQPGIEAQLGDASPELTSLLSCMADSVPANVGEISSISDSKITSGDRTFEQCNEGGKTVGCAHSIHSCHYGGKKCEGQSYAVDFGDEANKAAIVSAASTCSNGGAVTFDEGNHVHVSIGNASGCECN